MSTRDVVVTAIVPCRNERAFIGRFLDDLAAQKGIDGEWEIVIADGMSDDGTWEFLEVRAGLDPRILLLRNDRQVVSSGLNRAIAVANGQYIVRLDVHTRYPENYIASCLDVIRRTSAHNVGGAARTMAEGDCQRAIAAAYASRFAVGPARFHFAEYEGEVDTVTYGCWRRSYLMELGGFDEALVRNQDDELNLRIRRNGGMIWQSPKIRSWYSPRSSLRSLFIQYFQYGYWKVPVIRKHKLPGSWRHLVPGLFVCAVVATGLMGFVWRPGLIGLFVLLLAYAGFLFAGSIQIAMTSEWRLLWRLPLTLAVFHVSYGLGFLCGLFGFRGSRSTTSLSR